MRAALVVLLLVGCHHRGASTPEEAFRQVERAVAAADGVTLFKYLDQPTRWSIESAFRDQQMMRTIIRAKYPDEEQARALMPLQAAAEADAAHYFNRSATMLHTWDQYRRRLGSVSGPIKTKADGANAMWVARQDGVPFHFAKDSDGNWGWSELGAEWQLQKDRANHALSTVRENARLYEKANP